MGVYPAGALAAWVPHSFWQGFFLVHHPLLAKVWGPLIGPIVALEGDGRQVLQGRMPAAATG